MFSVHFGFLGGVEHSGKGVVCVCVKETGWELGGGRKVGLGRMLGRKPRLLSRLERGRLGGNGLPDQK